MPHLSAVPDQRQPHEPRDAELQVIARELTGLLITIVGQAYALQAALPNGSQRRDAGDLQQAAQRAAILVEQLAGLVGIDPPDGRPEWETD